MTVYRDGKIILVVKDGGFLTPKKKKKNMVVFC